MTARRHDYDFGITLKALLLTTLPDSTSQKFLLLGSLSRKDAGDQGRHALVFLDFASMRMKQCRKSDMEKWYARPAGKDCLMGHKVRSRSTTLALDHVVTDVLSLSFSPEQQWYLRRKTDADCYLGNKFEDPVGHDDNCDCTDSDFEWCAASSPRAPSPSALADSRLSLYSPATSDSFVKTETASSTGQSRSPLSPAPG